MGTAIRILLAACMITGLSVGWWSANADEISAGDKLRILYSNRLTFNDAGTPLITVELMSGQSQVVIRAKGGVVVRPDGAGGSEITAGSRWTITHDRQTPAKVKTWTVVETLAPNDADYGQVMTRAIARWTERGHLPRAFEVGAVFGVAGEVIDSRRTLIAVDPAKGPKGEASAAAIARRYSIETQRHRELVRRPHATITAQSERVAVRNPDVLWFAPARAGDDLVVEDVVVGGGGSQLETRRETRRYAGSIYVTVGADGALTVVNAIPADRLLAGLVPSEMYPDAPADALAAQAIAARTELLQKLGKRHLTDPYMLCSSQHCQVYSGAGREHPRTNQAVARTRGMVLSREGDGLVDARYSAACGGHTESAHRVWDMPSDPILQGHLDIHAEYPTPAGFSDGIGEDDIDEFLALPGEAAYCGQTRYSKGRYRWTRELDVAELSRRVGEKYPGVGRVKALEPIERGVSGRIVALRVQGSGKTQVVRGELHIRRLLGGLRSSAFVAKPIGDPAAPTGFTLTGAGFGHGVGMCQLGAIGMANAGKAFAAILQHYYPHSRLRRLY